MTPVYNPNNPDGLAPSDDNFNDLFDFDAACDPSGMPDSDILPGNGTAGQYHNGESSRSAANAIDNTGPTSPEAHFSYSDFLESPTLNGQSYNGESSRSAANAGLSILDDPLNYENFKSSPTPTGQYYNGESSRSAANAAGDAGPSSQEAPLSYDADFIQSSTLTGPGNASSPDAAAPEIPTGDAATEPSSPTSPVQTLSKYSQRILDRLPENVRESVGWNPQLDRMFHEAPHFVPTFNFEAMWNMNARQHVNKVSGAMPPAVDCDSELEAFREQVGLDFHSMTCEELASMGHEFLDMMANHPRVADIIEQYRYEPVVEPETINTILPKVGHDLQENPLLLNYYQHPLRKGDTLPDFELEDIDMADDADEEDEEENRDIAPANDGKKKGKARKGESKYFPRKVQYRPYTYMFKTAEEARAHRKKVRNPPKIARDIDRVEKYGRYYWTKRIYESMINIDLIFDNKSSTIATNFSKIPHFKEEDLEATAHHIFDMCICIHRRGWVGYDYNRRDYTRGKLKDTFPGSIEARLERICGILKHSKAIANDCITGGDLLMQTVNNPIHRASTKTANNKGNLDRAYRLMKQETDRQRAKRLAKEEEQRKKAEEKAEEKARKDAEKAEEKARKDAEKAEEKARKEAEKAAEKARKEAEKAVEKARKEAEKQAERVRKQAEKEAAAAARRNRA